jgi:hypothetical protein
MGIFKLIRAFQKANGRSPTPSELNKLKQQADIMSKQENIIPFPQGGKNRVPVNEQFKSAGVKDAVESMFGPLGKKPESGIESLDEFKALENAYEDELIKKEITPEFIESIAKEIKNKKKIKGARPGNINYEEMQKKFSNVKLYGDESFDELLQIEKTGKHPRDKADGGRAGYAVGGLSKLLKMLQGKVGKKNITTADKIARPESALNREMFGEFNERVNRQILDVPPMPGGFQLSREKLLKNFPELDESYADEIMAMDKELQGRVLMMLKDRRKNPEAYDKLLMEKGDTLDFQGEFDRSVKRSKNAAGGLAYMLGETRDGLEKGGSPSDVAAYRQMSLLDRDFDTLDLDEIIDILKSIGVDNKADGGIIGLKEGGPPNPGRRNFMKLMAGLASIPVLGKFFKPAAKVAKTVVPLQNTTTTMPTWFPKLIDKALDKGIKNKIDADLTDIKVPELPGVKIQRHDDGRVLVEGKNEYGRPYAMEYEPPGYEVIDEATGKAVKTKGDFKAIDSVPENSGYPDDVPDFWPEQLDEVDEILGSDVRVMEEFATGSKIKNPKRGENVVGQAEVRAENAADEAAERAAMEAEDFATGGLAKLLGE